MATYNLSCAMHDCDRMELFTTETVRPANLKHRLPGPLQKSLPTPEILDINHVLKLAAKSVL